MKCVMIMTTGVAALKTTPSTRLSGWALKATTEEIDPFGARDEKLMMESKREGQFSFESVIDVKEADPFGFQDEALATAALSTRRMSADPFGYFDDDITISRGGPSSRALPFMTRPKILDEVQLAGDFGFDPLNLSGDSAERLLFMRDAELHHARLAMLATVGWPIAEILHPTLASTAQAPSVVSNIAGLNPSVLNGGLQNVPPVFWVGAIVTTLVIELIGLQAKAEGKMPGDLGLRAGSKQLASAIGGDSRSVADVELVNGRLAMLAVVGFVAQEFLTKLNGIPVPVVAQNPHFFEPFIFW